MVLFKINTLIRFRRIYCNHCPRIVQSVHHGGLLAFERGNMSNIIYIVIDLWFSFYYYYYYLLLCFCMYILYFDFIYAYVHCMYKYKVYVTSAQVSSIHKHMHTYMDTQINAYKKFMLYKRLPFIYF